MMLKSLFDFSGSKQRKLARLCLLVGIVVAIVILAFGIKEILDVKHMKELLEMSRPTMGAVLQFLTRKYLVWALPILFAGIAAFYTLRYLDNKKQSA